MIGRSPPFLFPLHDSGAERRPRCLFGHTVASGGELPFELLLTLVQALQAQLPTMQLNAELVDVARDFGALRFVLLQLVLQIRDQHRIRRGGFDLARLRNRGRLPAALAL